MRSTTELDLSEALYSHWHLRQLKAASLPFYCFGHLDTKLSSKIYHYSRPFQGFGPFYSCEDLQPESVKITS